MNCSQCHDDAFLFCSLCKAYYCNEHKCLHLDVLHQEVVYDETFPSIEDGVKRQHTNYGSTYGGQHFLSYANILSSMSDAKLRDAVARYKTLIRQLEDELLARGLGYRTVATQDWTDLRQNEFSTRRVHNTRSRTLERIASSLSNTQKQVLIDLLTKELRL